MVICPAITEDCDRATGRLALCRPDHEVRARLPHNSICLDSIYLRLNPVTLPTNLKQIPGFPFDDFANQFGVGNSTLAAQAFQTLDKARLKSRVKVRVDVDVRNAFHLLKLIQLAKQLVEHLHRTPARHHRH